MKYCPKCREQYPDSSVFCGNDGSPLKGGEDPSPETSGAYCKACGEKVEPDTLFCPGCGAKVHGQGSPDSVQRRREPGTEERRFTMGTDESLDRTVEVERPQHAGANRTEELHSRRRARRGLYAAGGAILAVALLAIFALPRFLDGWRLSGPVSVPNSPSPSQSSAPPPSPSLPEPSPAPDSLGGAAIAPPSSEQTAATPPIENPAAVATKEPIPLSKSTKRPSRRSTSRESELAANRESGSPFISESAKTEESKQLELARKEDLQTATKGGASEGSAFLKETPVPRRPAEPGTYETIRVAMARQGPSDSAEIVDQIKPRTRLTVMGSEGDWLVVHSIARNRTVYVRRDDAMFVSEKISTAPSGRELEIKWRDLERQIQQAILNRGITGVSVSFIRDTAYLKGTVKTENQRFTAEQAARSFPEVIYVYNGIWVNP